MNIDREDAKSIRFPVRLLTVAWVLTTATFAWFGGIILDARRDVTAFEQESLRIETLRGEIVQLDEALTMSANMAAATGESQWEARYRRLAPQLDAAIGETLRLGGSPSTKQAANRLDEANRKLVEMEDVAFGLVRAGRAKEAQAVLSSPEYGTRKQTYAEGIASFCNLARQRFDESQADDRHTDLLSGLAAIVVGGISLISWLSVLRGLRRWRAALNHAVNERTRAEQALRQAQTVLERRVEERTADLTKSNETLLTEVAERKRAEWQLNIQYAISRILAESPTVKQASVEILRTVCENLNWDLGEFFSLDRRAQVMRFDGVWLAPGFTANEFLERSREITFERGVGLPGRVWESGQPAWIPDVVVDTNFPRAAAAQRVGLHGAVSFPIQTGGEVGGVIELFSREVREPDEELLRIVAVLGSQLGQFFERKRLEDHLVQSQKMETVGKLSGGIAHEFNSILTAIIGQSEMLLSDLPTGDRLTHNAQQIRTAADRAATLTRQLLAFGRKQILQPEILDLNRLLAGLEGTLHHVTGGGIDVQIAPAADLQTVKADAGQIEQVIVNMAMNARDAMPNGGKLTLETGNVTIDPDSLGRHPELRPGDYVTLSISDTGAGLSDEVKKRLFEPFFTTKDVRKGTGLGLASCDGIVRQSGGHISVYSERGRGSSFKIYLPQAVRQAHATKQRPASPEMPRGTETVLLVEDDPALREMAATLLGRLGYTVLTAADGIEALGLTNRTDTGHIDLVFTDVVMPRMSGKELSDRIRALRPDTKVLFTSAYTENAIVNQAGLHQGVLLLQKPFTPSALALKVREVLTNDAKT